VSSLEKLKYHARKLKGIALIAVVAKPLKQRVIEKAAFLQQKVSSKICQATHHTHLAHKNS
jgi:hypothetical protein